MMYSAYVFLALLVSVHSQQGGANNNLADIIKDIWSTAATTAPTPSTTTTLATPIRGPSTIVPGVVTTTPSGVDVPCNTTDYKLGICIPYFQCTDNNTVNTDGTGLIDIRLGEGPCPGYMDTCCLPSYAAPEPIKPTQKPEVQERFGCGWRNPNGVGFMAVGTNDNETQFAEFPWVVACLRVEPLSDEDPDGVKLNVYVGGGSLIHPSVVLTAAHYVATAKNIRIRAGEWDTQNTKEPFPHQDRDVSSIVVHKDFNGGNLYYDIALLFLEKPVDLAPNVGVVCLPEARSVIPSGTRCFASGWGKDRFEKDGHYQVILKRVELPVVDNYSCQEKLRRTRLGSYFELHTSFMCAGGEAGIDTCRGDGGSPLACPIASEAGRYQQTGIVAWGIECGKADTPGVYVNVARLRSWIDENVRVKGFDTKAYTI